MMPWFRVPEGLADLDAKEQLAWVYVLCQWHKGKPATEPSVRELTGWGGSKAGRFLKEVAEWAQINGAATPTPSRGKSGVKAGWKRGETGVSDKPQSATISENRGESGVKAGWKRGETGVSAPENQPPPPTPEALKKEREIKNSQIPPTPQNPPSPSEPAGEGLDGKENLDFLSRSDREALAKHGIKTVAGLKAAEARNPIRYSKGVGQARAARILAAVAAHEGKPFISDSTDSIDDVLANFWKEQPNGPKHATA